ncbi:hypothetical protein EAX61_07250 [Dokdonia sinensis]|uniref:Uncharacterized protein n=2 Tax=Dokdonia sinensis TaxID=2479847 RepID=A0A3M0G8W9_9FLAO|nr:hypothetical protein EAX61_07250 [Dokdonia sinensis]
MYSFDYVVDYEIPNREKQTTDTVKVAFHKEGKYLWSNSDFIAKSLGQGFLSNNPKVENSLTSNIVFELETGDLIVGLENDDTAMMMKLNAGQFLKQDNLAKMDDIALKVISTGQTNVVMGSEYPIYEIYPSNNPGSSMLMTIDDSKDINSTAIFQYIVEMVAGKKLNKPLTKDLPKGLIIKVEQNGNQLLSAIRINEEKKTIHYDYYLGEKL